MGSAAPRLGVILLGAVPYHADALYRRTVFGEITKPKLNASAT